MHSARKPIYQHDADTAKRGGQEAVKGQVSYNASVADAMRCLKTKVTLEFVRRVEEKL